MNNKVDRRELIDTSSIVLTQQYIISNPVDVCTESCAQSIQSACLRRFQDLFGSSFNLSQEPMENLYQNTQTLCFEKCKKVSGINLSSWTPFRAQWVGKTIFYNDIAPSFDYGDVALCQELIKSLKEVNLQEDPLFPLLKKLLYGFSFVTSPSEEDSLLGQLVTNSFLIFGIGGLCYCFLGPQKIVSTISEVHLYINQMMRPQIYRWTGLIISKIL